MNARPCRDCQDAEAAPGRSRCYPCYGRSRRLVAAVKAEAARLEGAEEMRVLMIDIETSPLVTYTWGLFDQNIGLNQLVEPTRMLCFAAKWLGDEDTMFVSEHWDGRGLMVYAAWDLLNKADVVMHFNGISFDVKHLNREFKEHGLTPPSPYRQLDLLLGVRKQFRLPSNKLQYVSTWLGLEGKAQHEGFDLWKSCLAGDPDAWDRMEAYNRQDVELLEDVYAELLPWLPSHPNRRLYESDAGCLRCGGHDLVRDGFARTQLSKFAQYRCNGCGSWFRETKRVSGSNLTGVAS